MSNEIDLFKYGQLVAQVEAMEKKIDKLEAGMEQLLELANKGRGGFWMGMMVVSAISALVGFITNHALKWFMPDPFGITEGTKALAGSLDSAREGSKQLSKSIEGIQHDGLDVAQQRARERQRAHREAELKKQNALIKALDEWNRKKQISDQEAKLKIDFVKKYGAKEWDALLKLKLDIENLERKNNEEFQHDLKEVRRVQFYCFAVAALIAWYLTWGIK